MAKGLRVFKGHRPPSRDQPPRATKVFWMGFLAWFSIQRLNGSNHGSCHRDGLIGFRTVK